MELHYSNDKAVQIWQRFVENPLDMSAQRNFVKHYGAPLVQQATKLHKRLRDATTVSAYNQQHGGKNRIELKQGQRANDPVVLKVRVNEAWRKYFNIEKQRLDSVLTMGEWQGQLNQVDTLCVIGVNKHKYNEI